MKKVFMYSLVLIALAACNSIEYPMESVPQEAVDAVFAKLDEELFDSEEIVLGKSHDPANFGVMGAKQIGLDNHNFTVGVLEQWCLAITYVTLTDERYSVDQQGVYLAGRYADEWIARRMARQTDARNRDEAVKEIWDFYCLEE